jgi:hypothetical protein
MQITNHQSDLLGMAGVFVLEGAGDCPQGGRTMPITNLFARSRCC